MNGLICAEVDVGEGIIPIDVLWEHKKASSECGQMTRQALRMRQIGQRTHQFKVHQVSLSSIPSLALDV
jgi:hypothetical protein